MFRPPLVWVTLVGIVLATTPVIGGWGTANWMTPWAEKEGSPALRADVLQARALTGIVGSLLGGWIASTLGRRTTYFLVSVASLLICALIFIYGYNETGRPIKATVCLIVGLSYTMLYATVTIGHLNILTITFVPMRKAPL